ncbi:MAG TPA: hypothetical protein VGR95_22835, partial [Thermoanaerobaculia bacterium]|nr:hypothetical protein [Thermoanaerobaculia bacterium]
ARPSPAASRHPLPEGEGVTRSAPGEGRAIARTVPLFPEFSVARDGNRITLTNTGDFTIRTRVYGEPGYRLIAKLFENDREIADRWIELPRDVAPGEQATVDVPYRAGATLRLYHAVEGIPMLDPEPWYAATL